MKTLIMVRNPLEVAYSMNKRNGTSYSFGLRLWEIYNRRVIETANEQERLVTHYDLFFEGAEVELRRIAQFIGLPDAQVASAAALVTKRRRHTHFTIDDLIDAGVAPEVIELYRSLMAEALPSRAKKTPVATAPRAAKSDEADLLPGTVSRLNAFVPERIGQIEDLYRELLAQSEARHKTQVEELGVHLAQTEAQHKTQVEELTNYYKTQVEELTNHYNREIEQLRERIMQMNQLLHDRGVSLAESEARGEDLRNRLRQQLKATQRLSRLLDEAEQAAARLRSSARWQLANPVAALKTKLSPARARDLLGYGHLEKLVSTYQKWRAIHPEAKTIDDQIQALASGTASAPAQKTLPVEPPVPTRPIEFLVHEQPEISIVIPVFNQCRYTLACLASLQEHQGKERFEVIVVDDCSTDATAETVTRMPGVVYLRNETNSGFIASCNHGAEAAGGKYLVFLNNDTIVTPGWLTALIDTFSQEPRTGIVGSKLVYPDGRLAGSRRDCMARCFGMELWQI